MAEEQHMQLIAISKAQGCSKVSLHVIIMGVMGTIYRSNTDTPLSKLGLDYCKAKKIDKGPYHTLCTVCHKTYQNQEEARFPPTQCKWDGKGFI